MTDAQVKIIREAIEGMTFFICVALVHPIAAAVAAVIIFIAYQAQKEKA